MKYALPLFLFLVACSSDATNDAGVADARATDSAAPDAAISDAGLDDGGSVSDASTDAGTPVATLPSGIRDRDGRPYVSLVLVSMANRTPYNEEPVDDALTTDPTDTDGGSTFGDDFQSALVMLDGLDGHDDWMGGSATDQGDDAGVFPHPLVNAWIGLDALLVDPNLPFSATGYLDLEVNGDAHATCGGRWLGDDALDKTMSYLVNKSLTGVSDGVSAPAKAPTLAFPYLAEPF